MTSPETPVAAPESRTADSCVMVICGATGDLTKRKLIPALSNLAAGRLLVARGARALARIVFALEGRWVPLDHWLEPELATLTDPASVVPMLLAALREGNPKPLEEALSRLEEPLAAEGVARSDGRRALFLELIHPSKAAERAVHGLV